MQRLPLFIITGLLLQTSSSIMGAAQAQTVSAKAQAEFLTRHRKCMSFMKATPIQCDPSCDPLCRFSVLQTFKLPAECDPPPDRNVCPQTK